MACHAECFWGTIVIRGLCFHDDFFYDDHIRAHKPEADRKASHEMDCDYFHLFDSPGTSRIFCHCEVLDAFLSPNLMALKYVRWNEGYRWTAYLQMGILAVCILSLPLWKSSEGAAQETEEVASFIRRS